MGFMFAIQNVDPRVGRFKVEHILKGANRDYEVQPIQMVDCDEFIDGNAYEGQSNSKDFNFDVLKSLGHEFGDLCPLGIDQVAI